IHFSSLLFFFFHDSPHSALSILSLHDALPIFFLEADDGVNTLVDYRYQRRFRAENGESGRGGNCTGKSGADLVLQVPVGTTVIRSEEHTSELQSRENIVCRLLLEKKKKKQ